MNTSLSVFNYRDTLVQTAVVDGEVWWVAADVCRILDIVNVSDAVSKLDDFEKLLSLLPIAGQQREVLCVNESGVYSLIFRSRKPEAKAFKRWVTGEVLPSIRKYGSYPPPLPFANSNRDQITPEQEKALVLKSAMHIWERFGFAPTANFVRTSFIKRLSTYRVQCHLEELVREGELEQFYTPHTRGRGKFKPVSQKQIPSTVSRER